MAVTVITPIALAFDTMSANLVDATAAIVPTVAADGWEITPPAGYTWDHAILKIIAPAGGDSVVIKAGDYPPAARKALGDKTLVLAANEVRYFPVEGGRYAKSTNKVNVTCSDTGTKLFAIFMPKL